MLNNTQMKDPSAILEVESQYLAAIEFTFTKVRLVSWQPLFDYRPLARDGRPTPSNGRHSQFWKSPEILDQYPEAEADRDLIPFEPVLMDIFAGTERNHEIDGVKGYVIVTRSWSQGAEAEVTNTRFCGLRFRRGGLWDEEPLGQASAYENTFLLLPDEQIVLLSVSACNEFSAPLAFSVSPSGSPSVICAITN